MHRIAKGIPRLAGFTVFCAAILLALLMDVPPLSALWRGVCCGVTFAVVVWLCAQVVVSVLRAGSQQSDHDGQG